MFNTGKATFMKVVLFLLLLVGVTSSMPAQATVEESPYISKIAPAHSNNAQPQEHAEAYVSQDELNTYLHELQEAGVRTKGDIKTLSYTELARLLSLWHLAHQMNYYAVEGQPKKDTNYAAGHESNDNGHLQNK